MYLTNHLLYVSEQLQAVPSMKGTEGWWKTCEAVSTGIYSPADDLNPGDPHPIHANTRALRSLRTMAAGNPDPELHRLLHLAGELLDAAIARGESFLLIRSLLDLAILDPGSYALAVEDVECVAELVSRRPALQVVGQAYTAAHDVDLMRRAAEALSTISTSRRALSLALRNVQARHTLVLCGETAEPIKPPEHTEPPPEPAAQMAG